MGAPQPPQLPTFRDPAGSLSLEPTRAVRSIHASAREQTLAFLDSALRHRLETRGDLIATTVEDAGQELKLIHPRVPIPTYPWEWTPSQWYAAANLTLTLAEEALADGWILKDATPLNILFLGARPVLVDVLSFEPWQASAPGNAIWLAYAQYVRTFLLPLLMARLLQWPLALTLFKRDGYEPTDLYGALSFTQRFFSAALVPVTLPALLDRRRASDAAARKLPAAKDSGLARHILSRTFASLRKRTRAALPGASASEWSGYTANLGHYTPQESAEKLAFVQAVLDEVRAANVLDIGANTGDFSRLAAATGASVVALERDAAAAERLYLQNRATPNILTIHADFARPTPAVGWQNAESTSLLQRLHGRFDLVLVLAVIHHLLLLEQIPLDRILGLLHELTSSHLLLEWVPVADPMFQSLMRGRTDLYGQLTEADLLRACTARFTILQREVLANGRVLFFLRRIEHGG